MESKEMQQLKVYSVKKDEICISQADNYGEEIIIYIHPDQVDTLIKWLTEAKMKTQSK